MTFIVTDAQPEQDCEWNHTCQTPARYRVKIRATNTGKTYRANLCRCHALELSDTALGRGFIPRKPA